MIGLLVFKEKLKQFYGKYNIYIVPVDACVIKDIITEVRFEAGGYCKAFFEPR